MTEMHHRRLHSGPARPLSMSEWVAQAAQASELQHAHAWAAMTAALGLLAKHADPDRIQPLYDAVDGAEFLARSEEARPRPVGGLVGGVLKGAGGLSGPAVADAMGVVDRLARQGVDKAALKRLLPAAHEALDAAVGDDLLGRAIGSVPGVGPLLGGDRA